MQYAPTIGKLCLTVILFWVTIILVITGAEQLRVVLMIFSTVICALVTVGQYYCDDARATRDLS